MPEGVEGNPSVESPAERARSAGVGAETSASTSREVPADRSFAVVRLAAVVLCAALAVIVVRVAQLQLFPSQQLIAHSPELNSIRPEIARRGDLRDRRGRVLATSRVGYRLFVDPTAVNAKEFGSLTALTDALAHLIGEDPRDLRSRLGTRADHPVGQRARDLLARQRADDAKRKKTAAAADATGGTTENRTTPAAADEAATQRIVQYLPLVWMLDPDQVDVLRSAMQNGRFRGLGLQPLLVRSRPQGDLASALVGIVGFDGKGLTGMERYFDLELTEKAGSLTYLRDNRLRTLWLNVADYTPPAAGRDVHLSIDLHVQTIAENALRDRVHEYNAGGGRLIVLDPQTGELLAAADYLNTGRSDLQPYTEDPKREENPALARPRWLTDPYEPGSTFKPFIWAAATELGRARLDEEIDCHQGVYRTGRGRRIRDAHPYGELTWELVLVKSSNIGMAQVAERMTERQMQEAVRGFGFGRPTGSGLPGETAGIVTSAKDWTHYTQTSVCMGHEVAVTPLQMVQAFSAFCRDGTMPLIRIVASPDHLPVPAYDRRFADRTLDATPTPAPADDGIALGNTAPRFTPAAQLAGRAGSPSSGVLTDPPATGPMPGATGGTSMGGPMGNPVVFLERRAISPEIARKSREVMRRVMIEGTGRKANEGAMYRMFGKSGTAELPNPKGGGYFKDRYICSFIGAAPLDDPRLVVLCVIEDPDRRIGHFGGVVAGPVVRNVLNEALAYLGVPSDLAADQRPDARPASGALADAAELPASAFE